jgi:phage terminase large subunit GpA-like protein
VAVTVGVDTGKRQCDWTAIAWMPDGTGHVIEYGEFPVDWKRLGTKAALVAALRQYANYCTWNRERGGRMPASQVWIDSGYHEHTDAVYTVCRELNNALGLKPGQERFRPSKGHGACQRMLTRYAAPKAVGSAVRYIGREYHLAQIPRARQILVHVNADHWKLQVRERFGQPADQPGALILYEGQPNEHADFLEQLAAEEPKEVYEPGKGTVIVWTTIRRKNHKLDSTYAAVAAGDYVLALQARARQRAEAGKWWAGRQRKPRRHA